MIVVLITAAVALVLAFVLGTALGFFREFFAVPLDPLVDNIRAALPGANCGACGFAGCENYALAVAAGNAGINSCTVGGSAVAAKLAVITGKAAEAAAPIVAVLACQGSYLHAAQKGLYTGIPTCRGAKLSAGGVKLCSYGCLGFGDCEKICKFGALSFNREEGLPVIDYSKCTGCRLCMSECPQGIIKAVPIGQKGAMPLCSNRSSNRQLAAKSCNAACIKCGQCVRQCPQQCIDLGGNIPVVDLTKCTSCGTCVEKCPTKVMKVVSKDFSF
jgi:Na+-translocating ferredoxin:NAD+ oxidoreductase RNF subunit RnfB